MEIKALNKNVITQLRSALSIDSVTQCVTELVLNSLDAKSTAIAVRVNLSNFRIQIVDNGKGISRQNLEFVGKRYMTTKCHSLADLKKHIKYYGFKGEALASISNICQRVTITSREQNCDLTYSKIIEKDEYKIDLDKERPSFGTTVTVDGFLSNLPVRQQRIKNSELENVKKNLEKLVIIHPRVSFSLRNDLTGKIMLDSRKTLDIAASFKNIHPEINENNFVLFKVSKNKTSVEALIHREFHENKRLQYIYVNKRPISCPKIQNFIASRLKKGRNDPKKAHSVYVIHIKCPYAHIDLNLEPSKTVVYFKKIDIINRCIEKIIASFLGTEYERPGTKKPEPNVAKSEFGVSQIGGAVKALAVKRRSEEDEIVPAKSPKIGDDPVFEEEPKMGTKAMKALPIEIKRNEKREVQEKFDDIKENSLYTEFPENERKGKDIIMDMFIKSVQVFPEESNGSGSSNRSCDNVAEVVKTPDVTINPSPNPIKEVETEKMVSVGVQAGPSFINEDTAVNDITFYPRKPLTRFVSDYDFDFSRMDSFPTFNFLGKGTCNLPTEDVFNQTKKLFDFRNSGANKLSIFEPPPLPCLSDLNETFYEREKHLPKMIIGEIHKKKILPAFDSSENVQKSPFFLKKKKNVLALKRPSQQNVEDNYQTQKHYSSLNKNNFEENVKQTPPPLPSLSDLNETFYEREKYLPKMIIGEMQKKQILPALMDGSENVQQSPFFLKKKKNVLALKRPSQQNIEDKYQTQKPYSSLNKNHSGNFEETLRKPNQIEMSCSRRNKARKNLNESTISSFFTVRKPVDRRSKDKFSQAKNKESQDLFFSTNGCSSPENESNIVITVEDEEARQNIINRDLLYEKQLNKDVLPSTFTQTQSGRLKGQKKDSLPPTLTEAQSDWVKEVNMFGTTLYTNKKTGVKSFSSPKKDLSFEVVDRFEFVPKGLSPLLKNYGKVEALSPESKENFNNAVIESYEDDLILVKWQNCIDNKDPKRFFKEIYLEKSKLIENAVPNVSKSALAKREIFENMSFTKDVFKNLEMIGQVDCKFIAALDKVRNLIILFDQHAVHERVRVEQLNEGYKNASTKLDQHIMIFLPHYELSLVRHQQTALHSLGLVFNLYSSGINIYQVPLCLYNKFRKGANLSSLTETLVNEIIEILKANNGILVYTPRIIQNIVNSEACRGAIKFGDSLSKTECFVHLKELAKCNLPFQCAHGRPTLTPLISLTKDIKEDVPKPRLYLLK